MGRIRSVGSGEPTCCPRQRSGRVAARLRDELVDDERRHADPACPLAARDLSRAHVMEQRELADVTRKHDHDADRALALIAQRRDCRERADAIRRADRIGELEHRALAGIRDCRALREM
jgi:hypothetical protein